MLDEAFEGDFGKDDWDHAIGGVHVWVTEGQRIVSHASVVERTLICSGRALSVGYVEAVATLQAYRRRGYATMVMKRVWDLIHERFSLGALSTGTHPFYERLGWERWLGATFVDGPGGRRRTPDDDGCIMILRTPRSPDLDPSGDIVCDWRAGDVW